jgi:hypothetical protein
VVRSRLTNIESRGCEARSWRATSASSGTRLSDACVFLSHGTASNVSILASTRPARVTFPDGRLRVAAGPRPERVRGLARTISNAIGGDASHATVLPCSPSCDLAHEHGWASFPSCRASWAVTTTHCHDDESPDGRRALRAASSTCRVPPATNCRRQPTGMGAGDCGQARHVCRHLGDRAEAHGGRAKPPFGLRQPPSGGARPAAHLRIER